jgi:hypothetical protein
MDYDALNDLWIDAQGTENVDVVTREANAEDGINSSLEPEQTEALSKFDVRGVYEVTLLIDGEEAGGESGFHTNGIINIGLPFELNPGETGDGAWAVYIAPDGAAEPMTAGRSYADGMTRFDTKHLSTYATTYMSGDTSIGGGGGGCAAGAGGLAALAALALAAAGFRKKKPR